MVQGKRALGVKHLAVGLVLLAVLTTGQNPGLAKKQSQKANPPDSTILTNELTGPFESIDDVLDPVTAQLLWQLSHKPELMNPEYLNYYLGPPDKQTSQIGVRSHAYYWYDQMRHLRCELYQELDNPEEVVESQILFHLPPSDLDFDLLKKTLGPPQRSYFDQSANPTQMYCYVPNTTLAMASPPNTFAVTKATIAYIGPPLPKPRFEDIQLAHDSFVARTQAARPVGGKVDWQETLVLARRQVLEQPTDAVAHATLAEALKKTGNVHDAIGEYKLALSLNKYNEPVRQQCIQGLKDLYVLPQNYGSDAEQVAGKRPLQFTHSGQRMRVAGNGSQNAN